MLSILGADNTRVRYLIAGCWNTLFGYASGLFLYYGFDARIPVVLVGVIANVLAISMAFFTYKVFVFRTRGNWLAEYLRAYVVYGGTAMLGILIIWLLVDGMACPFWIAQGLAIVLTVIFSYVLHSRFTFRRRGIEK